MEKVIVIELNEVYLHDRHHQAVKHVKRSDEAVTLCSRPVDKLVSPTSLNRICLVCDRAKVAFLAEQAKELQMLAQWVGAGKITAIGADLKESCPGGQEAAGGDDAYLQQVMENW